ncbi:hypothetical protein [Halomonas litopenaei]|uniref:hypothetical protein n=1 Tax=Halomonas litopenaei TaxID=2109328 RepID=UPI003F9EE0C6
MTSRWYRAAQEGSLLVVKGVKAITYTMDVQLGGIMDTVLTPLKWAAQRGYEKFTQAKLRRALERAASENISIEELVRKEEKFAIFVRMVRALEQCSNNEMADYLADLMIGGIKGGADEDDNDLFQILMSSLGSLTLIEVKIIYLMRECGLYGAIHRERVDQEAIDKFEAMCWEGLGVEGETIGNLVNGMIRTGLVSIPPQAWGGPFRNSNLLTPLAQDLFHFLDYKRQLT